MSRGPEVWIASAAFFFADRLREETGRRVGILQTSVGGGFIASETIARPHDDLLRLLPN
jgi:hypothetical protein